ECVLQGGARRAAHFEVGPEVLSEFRRIFGDAAPVARESPQTGKGHVDLRAALALQMRQSGVERADVLPGCTHADESLYFSHRRDRGLTGRMIGLIGPRA
ncbi:MAG: laccase domain-containing protein, partial [Planctomycetota bacterium]